MGSNPPVKFEFTEKLEIAYQLERLGVDIIGRLSGSIQRGF
jgi:isopropylmalate/homocitrate/citramalate synthase